MSVRGKDARRRGDRNKVEQGHKPGAPTLKMREPESRGDEPGEDGRHSFIRELTPPRRIDVEALSVSLPGNPRSRRLGEDLAAPGSPQTEVLPVETYRSLPTPEIWPDLFSDEIKEGFEAPIDPSDVSVPWSKVLPGAPPTSQRKPRPQKK